MFCFFSDESNLTPGHLRTPNPDIVNEDDIRVNQNNTEDIKIDKYIIPVKSKTEGKEINLYVRTYSQKKPRLFFLR